MQGKVSIEIIPNRLYWVCDRVPPVSKGCSYFCVDNTLVYTPLATDFGPLNLAMVTQYLKDLTEMLSSPKLETLKLIHYTSQQPDKKVNSALLMGAYLMIIQHRTAEEVFKLFSSQTEFVSFCDASGKKPEFTLSLFDCLSGLKKGVEKEWFDVTSFVISDYVTNSRVETGGFNWVVPGKLLAFICPAVDKNGRDGVKPLTPEEFSPIFQTLGVSGIIRLNKKNYDSDRFTRLGFRFYDLYFIDGSVPSLRIVQSFIKICESHPILAVHCKAGLGRTGTLIGCYIMKHFTLTARETIAWIRICRPGSIIGVQQQFLVDMEKICWKWGEDFRNGVEEAKDENFVLSDEKSKFGDYKQGERLAGPRLTACKTSPAILSKWKIAKKQVFNKNK